MKAATWLSIHHMRTINFLSAFVWSIFSSVFCLQCLAKVREAFVLVEATLLDGNFTKVAGDFGCCQTPKNPDDQVMTSQFLRLNS